MPEFQLLESPPVVQFLVMLDSVWPHGLYSPSGSSVRGISQARILEQDLNLSFVFSHWLLRNVHHVYIFFTCYDAISLKALNLHFSSMSHGIIQILFDWLNKKLKWQGSRDVLRNYLFCTNAMLSWCACRYTCVCMCVCVCACVCVAGMCGVHMMCVQCVWMGMPCGVCMTVLALRCASKSRGQRPL